jgi:hypothetical protein
LRAAFALLLFVSVTLNEYAELARHYSLDRDAAAHLLPACENQTWAVKTNMVEKCVEARHDAARGYVARALADATMNTIKRFIPRLVLDALAGLVSNPLLQFGLVVSAFTLLLCGCFLDRCLRRGLHSLPA